MIDNDDYPPYAKRPAPERLPPAGLRTYRYYTSREVIGFVLTGLVAGLAIGGLLVAYGVF